MLAVRMIASPSSSVCGDAACIKSCCGRNLESRAVQISWIEAAASKLRRIEMKFQMGILGLSVVELALVSVILFSFTKLFA